MSFHRRSNGLNHVSEWIDGGPKKWGYDRFGKMLELYVYRKLVLEVRYPDHLSGKSQRVDRAFAAYWANASVRSMATDRQMDSVIKLRRQLNNRLGKCPQ